MRDTHLEGLELALEANLAVIVWGQPGIGKTARIRQAALRRGWPVLEVIASQKSPEDLGGGWPTPTPTGLRFEPGAGYREFSAAALAAGGGILFLDELSCATPAHQASAMRLILEKMVGDFALPKCVRVVAAANPPDTAAGGWDLAAPTANRLWHATWPCPTTEQWTDWLVTGAIKNEDTDSWTGPAGDKARGVAAGYLKSTTGRLFSLPASEVDRGKAWPSPRSWEAATRALAAAIHIGADEEVTEAALQGCLGDAVGLEFATYVRDRDLPDPQAVYADPDSWTVDRNRSDRVLATLAATVSLVAKIRKPTPEQYRAGWKVIDRASKCGQAGVAAIAARSLAKIGKLWGHKLPPEAEIVKPMLKAAGLVL